MTGKGGRPKSLIKTTPAERSKKYRAKCKREAISHYSQGLMCCACCDDHHFEFLAIDHINGGGYKAYKIRRNGNIHQWLRHRGFPTGYRVLCHNCNMSLGFYGYCPHKGIQ